MNALDPTFVTLVGIITAFSAFNFKTVFFEKRGNLGNNFLFTALKISLVYAVDSPRSEGAARIREVADNKK